MLISASGEIRVIFKAKDFVIICVICVEINLYKHYELAIFINAQPLLNSYQFFKC